jgi:hypothetical protein
MNANYPHLPTNRQIMCDDDLTQPTKNSRAYYSTSGANNSVYCTLRNETSELQIESVCDVIIMYLLLRIRGSRSMVRGTKILS